MAAPLAGSLAKQRGRLFKKIPKEVLMSPSGAILIISALFIEAIGFIPIPVIDQLWEIPLDILFIILLKILGQVPFTSAIIPFIIERIPIVSDIVPSFLIRLFI